MPYILRIAVKFGKTSNFFHKQAVRIERIFYTLASGSIPFNYFFFSTYFQVRYRTSLILESNLWPCIFIIFSYNTEMTINQINMFH